MIRIHWRVNVSKIVGVVRVFIEFEKITTHFTNFTVEQVARVSVIRTVATLIRSLFVPFTYVIIRNDELGGNGGRDSIEAR